MRRRQRPRSLRPSQRTPPQPAPAPPAKATPADVERALERRIALQRGMTQEVKRTAAAYRALGELQGLGVDELELPHFRNPHDRVGTYDLLERKQPITLGLSHYALLLPGLKERMRAVPGKAIVEYAEDDDGPFVLIQCPCGGKPIAREMVEKCVGCERYYTLLAGRRATVIYGAMPVPGRKQDTAPEEQSSCTVGECDGSGFVVDEATNTSWDCRCRPALIESRRSVVD